VEKVAHYTIIYFLSSKPSFQLSVSISECIYALLKKHFG